MQGTARLSEDYEPAVTPNTAYRLCPKERWGDASSAERAVYFFQASRTIRAVYQKNQESFESLPESFQDIVMRLAWQTNLIRIHILHDKDIEAKSLIESLEESETDEEKAQEPYLVLLLNQSRQNRPPMLHLVQVRLWEPDWVSMVGCILRNEDKARVWLGSALQKTICNSQKRKREEICSDWNRREESMDDLTRQ